MVNSMMTKGFFNSLPTYPEHRKTIWRTVIRVKLFTPEELVNFWDVPTFACLDYLRFRRHNVLRSQYYFGEQRNEVLDQ